MEISTERDFESSSAPVLNKEKLPIWQIRFLRSQPQFRRHMQYFSHHHVSSQAQRCSKGYLFQRDHLVLGGFTSRKRGKMPSPFTVTKQTVIPSILHLVKPQEQLPFVLAGKAVYYRAHTKGTEHQHGSGKRTGARSTAVLVLKSSLWAYSSPKLLFDH